MNPGLSQQPAPSRLREEESALGHALEQMIWHTGGVPVGARARVWERLERTPRKHGLARLLLASLGGAALACALLLAFLDLRPRAPERLPLLEQVAGKVLLESDAGSRAVQPGELPTQARLRVEPGGAAVVALGDTRLVLAPGALLQLGEQPALLEGMVAATVPQARRFRLAAGAAVFEGSGGILIASAGASRTSVYAESGSVRVLGAAEATEVSPGASWTAGLGGAPAGSGEQVRERAQAEALAALARAAEPLTSARLRQLAALRPDPRDALDDAAHLLARAHDAEAAKRYAEAAGLYAEAARVDGPRAAPALYELARLQLRFLGQPAAALASLEQERARFPDSPLAQEVALTAIDARIALDDEGASLREMDGFLSRFSSSERSGEVRWLRARLELRHGECGAATSDLELLAGDPIAGGEALLGQAFCARRAGDEAGAAEKLRAYLRRFPRGPRREEARAALGGAPLEAP